MSFLQSENASAQHRELSRLAGEWSGVTRTWFMPGQLTDEQPQHGRMRTILDGRFLLHEYETMLQGYPCQGVAIYGYSEQNERCEVAWVDSCHNGTNIMFSTGGKADGPFSVMGHYPVEEGDPWGWRTEITIQDDDHVTITHFNITPAGEEAKGVETVYTRAA